MISRLAVTAIEITLLPATAMISFAVEWFAPDVFADPAVVRWSQSMDEVMENTAKAFAETA